MKTQKMLSFYKNKSQYLDWVDAILVQICSYAKNNIDDSKSVNRAWRLSDFEIHNKDIIIPSFQECICKKIIPSPLKEYGLYEIFLQLLMLEEYKVEQAPQFSAMDLPASFQEFDTILELLSSKESYDFWDFPISMAEVDLIDVDTKVLIKKDKVFIDEIGEVFVFPDRVLINGIDYKILDAPKIHYSFLRKQYVVYAQRDMCHDISLQDYDLGMIAFDNHNREMFVPLENKQGGIFKGQFTLLPKPYLPYVSVSLVLRNKKSKSTRVDSDNHNFKILPEICVYLLNSKAPNTRNVQIVVSCNSMFGGLLKTEIYIRENDKLEISKTVEMQL